MIGLLRGRRVVVVAPHFDDEVIGCGGALLKARAEMDWLAIVHVTEASEQRLSEFNAIRDALGVDTHVRLAARDGFVANTGDRVVEQLIEVIQLHRPDVVLAPHRDDDHEDHRAVAGAVWQAAGMARYWSLAPPARPHRVEHVVGYDVWTPLRSPSVVCDVTDVFAQKRALVRAYTSQLADFPYEDYVTALDGWRGMLHHKSGYAEAYAIQAR